MRLSAFMVSEVSDASLFVIDMSLSFFDMTRVVPPLSVLTSFMTKLSVTILFPFLVATEIV